MKRTLGLLAGTATLAAGVYLGSHVWAQQGNYTQATYTPASHPLQSKIAILNLAQVIKNYKKYQNFEAELKSQSQTLQRDLEAKKGQIVSYQKELEKPDVATARKDQIEHEMKHLQREIQDAVEEAKQRYSKQDMDELIKTYKEVSDAVAVYCRAYAIELVLQYNDAPEAEKYLPPHFVHRLSNRACMPIYVDPRMDITEPITQMLNQRLAATTNPAPRN